MIGEEVQTSKGLKRFSVLFVLCALGGIFINKFIQKTVQSHWRVVNDQLIQQKVSATSPVVVRVHMLGQVCVQRSIEKRR